MKSTSPPRPNWLSILGWLLVAILVGFGTARIRFDVNPLRLLPQEMPEVRGLTAYVEHFALPDELVLVLDGPDARVTERAAVSLSDHLRKQRDVTGAVISEPPGEGDPQALAEIVAYLLANQDPEELRAFTDDLAPDRAEARIAATVESMTFDLSPEAALMGSYDPLGFVPAAFGKDTAGLQAPTFQSPDGRLRLLYVWPPEPLPRAASPRIAAWTDAVRQTVEEWRSTSPDLGQVRVRLTGEPAIMAEVSGGMQRDMMSSGVGTMVLVALIFWFVYRRLRPLAALLAMLALVFVATLGIAGLVLRDLTVMNVGFASILIGLAVDYGIIVYQHGRLHPGDASAVRRATRTGILCAAATTAAAFASLMASGLPSLAELGTVVAIGILVGATGMLGPFASWISRIPHRSIPGSPERPSALVRPAASRAMTVLVLLLLAASIWLIGDRGWPALDGSERSTRPRVSEGYDALDDVASMFGGDDGVAGSLFIHAPSASQARQELVALGSRLEQAVEGGTLRRFFVPLAFVPDSDRQRANLSGPITSLLSQEERLASALNTAGFDEQAAGILRAVFASWRDWTNAEAGVPRLIHPGARWLTQRLVSEDEAGALWVSATFQCALATHSAAAGLQSDQVFLADWALTMDAMRREVPKEMGRILVALSILVLLLLVITFRRPHEVSLVILGLALSLLILAAMMSLLGWTWNFFNLAAILLCIGAGLDYSVHILLAARHGDTLDTTRQALLVCALSSTAGFGSLSWASNLGLASLGRTCAIAMAANALVAIYFLPTLLSFSVRPNSRREPEAL